MTAKVIRMEEFRKKPRTVTFEDIYFSWSLAAICFALYGIAWLGTRNANRQILAKRQK